MRNSIQTPTMGEVIREEFLEPNGISIDKLAYDTNISVSILYSIIQGDSDVTADISLRLARYFGVSDTYFLDIQSDINERNKKQ